MEKEYIERIVEIEQRGKSNTKRIDEHDEQLKELSNVYVALTKMDNKVTNVETDVSEMKKDIKDIKDKPGKRLEQIIGYILGAIIALLIGYIFGKIGIK